MKTKIIRKRYYTKSIILWCGYLLVIPVFLLSIFLLYMFVEKDFSGLDSAILYFVIPISVVILLALVLIFRQFFIVRNYAKHVKSLKDLKSVDKDFSTTFKESSLLSAYDSSHKVARTIVGDKYIYADIEKTNFDTTDDAISRSILGKRFKSSTTYVSAISVNLSRKLPQIIFDSKKYKGRTTRYYFSSTQLYEFEGDINNYFRVYLPSTYEIDSLSFISPEVLWAMRDAADYDIEIVDDKLFLIGPVLLDGKSAYEDMVEKILNIEKALADNIDTYRDERIPFERGRAEVHARGSRLMGGLEPVILLGLVSLAGCLFVGFSSFKGDFELVAESIVWVLIPVGLFIKSLDTYLKQVKSSKEPIKKIDESTKNILTKDGIKEQTAKEEITSLIKKSREEMVPESEIRRSLELDGWSKYLIDEALEVPKNYPKI